MGRYICTYCVCVCVFYKIVSFIMAAFVLNIKLDTGVYVHHTSVCLPQFLQQFFFDVPLGTVTS